MAQVRAFSVLLRNICVAFAQKLINSEMFDFQFIVCLIFNSLYETATFCDFGLLMKMKTFWTSFMHHIMVEMSSFYEWSDRNGMIWFEHHMLFDIMDK
jgi:hypothetical protein